MKRRLVPVCLAAAACICAAAASPALPVSPIRSLRAMDEETRKEAPAVRIRGVVTFHDERGGLTCVQDESGGMELYGAPASVPLRRGMRIEVSGRVDPTRPQPTVTPAGDGLEVLETGPLPAPVPFSGGARFSGELDGLLCTMEAAVFSIAVTRERGGQPWLRLNTATAYGHLTWLLPWQHGRTPPGDWLHAKVRATGVCEAIHNQSGQRVGTLVLVNSPEDLEILQPPAADPFARPTRHLSDLLRPDLQPPDERARIEGTVLHIRHEPLSELYLRTRQGAIRVEFTGRPDIAVGDRIAAVGYPALSNKQATLLECVVRRIGHGPPPDPAGIEIGELLESGRHSDLVKIHGKILRNTATVNGGSVFLESSNRVAEVLLPENLAPGPRRKLIDQLRPGASVALAGIAVLRGTMSVEGTVVMTDMQLLLRGPADVTLLARPSWWTTGRLLALAASLAAVLALSFLWVLLLRRRVAAQTEIIREKIVHETRWIERSRIARDIHDDAGSALTQIMLLGELGRRGAGDDPEAGEQFQRISRQAREAVRALDAIVWTTNPKNDSLAVTVSYICQTVQDLARDAGISCRLEIPDDVPPVSVGAKVRHNLLLAVKEAAHNVIKHSDARMLRLRIVAGPDELRIGIVDDGHGFDPARVTEHRTGMESMRKRMEESGGSFEIASGDGSGTSISFILPWSALG